MDLFYKMEVKDKYMEKVLNGGLVASPYYQEGYHRVKVISNVNDTSWGSTILTSGQLGL